MIKQTLLATRRIRLPQRIFYSTKETAEKQETKETAQETVDLPALLKEKDEQITKLQVNAF